MEMLQLGDMVMLWSNGTVVAKMRLILFRGGGGDGIRRPGTVENGPMYTTVPPSHSL